jgi:hypothetical protein
MSADFILMEGIRMVDEWPIIEKKIPSMDIVFRTVVDASMIEVGGGDDEAGDALQGLSEPKRTAASSTSKIRLTHDEERIYRKIDGSRTVQAIIDGTGMTEFEVCRILFDLLNRNIITTVGRGVAREAQAGRAEPVSSAGASRWVLPGVALLALVLAGFARREPFAVVGRPPLLADSYDLLMEGVSRSRLERLDRAILAYHLLRGAAPKTLEALAEEGLVDRTYLKDPWARPYHYALTDNGYLLNAVDDSGKSLSGTVIERTLPAERP